MEIEVPEVKGEEKYDDDEQHQGCLTGKRIHFESIVHKPQLNRIEKENGQEGCQSQSVRTITQLEVKEFIQEINRQCHSQT